jgi:hypothetical protein
MSYIKGELLNGYNPKGLYLSLQHYIPKFKTVPPNAQGV